MVTVLVQSSSTTSLMVPLVGSGVFRVRDIYPFTLGTNIGTTITALLAATAVSGPHAVLVLQIALIHFLYNLSGVVVIYGIQFLREIPLNGAEMLARVASERRTLALVHVKSLLGRVRRDLELLEAEQDRRREAAQREELDHVFEHPEEWEFHLEDLGHFGDEAWHEIRDVLEDFRERLFEVLRRHRRP